MWEEGIRIYGTPGVHNNFHCIYCNLRVKILHSPIPEGEETLHFNTYSILILNFSKRKKTTLSKNKSKKQINTHFSLHILILDGIKPPHCPLLSLHYPSWFIFLNFFVAVRQLVYGIGMLTALPVGLYLLYFLFVVVVVVVSIIAKFSLFYCCSC